MAGLLTVEPSARLGVGGGGVAALRTHEYFVGFEWDRLAGGQLEAPITPAAFTLPRRRVHVPALGPLPDWAKVSDKVKQKFTFVDKKRLEESYAHALVHGTASWDADGAVDWQALSGWKDTGGGGSGCCAVQ